ncbi:MAG: alpha/beta hydrolase, partial [Verrucomicrobiota bacterium]
PAISPSAACLLIDGNTACRADFQAGLLRQFDVGPHTDDEWKFLTEIVVRRQPDGRYKMHYDPALAEPFKHQMPEGDLELWPLYDAIRSKMLVLRGELSDLLKRETCDAMTQRGPKAKIVEIPGVGHAPTLMHADQIAIVRDFLIG